MRASSSPAPMRAASRTVHPSASLQASSAAAVACGQANDRWRADAILPSATTRPIRTASPQAAFPAAPWTAPGPASPAMSCESARSTQAAEYTPGTLDQESVPM